MSKSRPCKDCSGCGALHQVLLLLALYITGPSSGEVTGNGRRPTFWILAVLPLSFDADALCVYRKQKALVVIGTDSENV